MSEWSDDDEEDDEEDDEDDISEDDEEDDISEDDEEEDDDEEDDISEDDDKLSLSRIFSKPLICVCIASSSSRMRDNSCEVVASLFLYVSQ